MRSIHQLNQPMRQTLVQSGGPEKVAELLNALSQDDKQMSDDLLEKLESRNPLLAQQVRKRLYTFDDLARFSPRDLQRVTREQEKSDLVLSLKLASRSVKTCLYQSLSKRAAEDLQAELVELGPVPIRDVEAAQSRIMDSVRRLVKCGEISNTSNAEDRWV